MPLMFIPAIVFLGTTILFFVLWMRERRARKRVVMQAVGIISDLGKANPEFVFPGDLRDEVAISS